MLVVSLALPAASPGIVICLDPGHGGVEVGAVGIDDCYEKEMNLNVGLAGWWVGNGWSDYQTVLTRTDDRAVALQERIDVAERNNAWVFLSIHHNGVQTNTIAHYTTYGLYCDQDLQASWGLWPYSQRLAADVTSVMFDKWGARRGLVNGGADYY